jgi:hypothetical protein
MSTSSGTAITTGPGVAAVAVWIAQQRLRHARGIGHLRHPFGDRAVHGAVVDLLEGIAARVARRNLADDQDQRHLVLLRGMHRDRRVARAGAAADADDAGPPGEPRVGDRHEACAGFVPAGDGVDVGASVERVEQAEIALAGHAEQPVDAVGDESVDDQLTNGAHRLPACDPHNFTARLLRERARLRQAASP